MQEEIAAKEGEEKKLKASIEVLNQASYRLKEDIVRWVQVQDRAIVDQRSCRKRMEELKEKNDLSKLTQTRLELERLEEKVRSAEEPLKKLMDKEDLIMEKISALQSQIKDSDRGIDAIQSEMKRALEESQTKEIPTVRVIEKIFPGTILESGHCKSVIKETCQHALIKETLHNEVSPDGNSISSWRMQFYSLS
jgi:chromosome segregation ATPase